jgi:hypothetical protein
MGSEVSEEPIASIFRSIVVLPYVYRNDPTVCKTCNIKLQQTGSNSIVAEARGWVHVTPIPCIHFKSAYSLQVSQWVLRKSGWGGGVVEDDYVVVSYSVTIFRLSLRSRLYVMRNWSSIPYWDIDVSPQLPYRPWNQTQPPLQCIPAAPYTYRCM